MELMLMVALMMGFLVAAGRGKREKRADVGVVELLLAGVFLLFVFGQAGG